MIIDWFWIAIVFIGAFALAGAIGWSRIRNKHSDVPLAKTERATKELRKELNERDKRR